MIFTSMVLHDWNALYAQTLIDLLFCICAEEKQRRFFGISAPLFRQILVRGKCKKGKCKNALGYLVVGMLGNFDQ